MKKSLNILVAISVWMLSFSCESTDPEPRNSLTFSFENVVGEQPLEISSTSYEKDGGSFTISAFKYYISNVVLLDAKGEEVYVEPESYHLITQADGEANLTFTISNIPNVSIENIQFSIGVDPEANAKTDNPGDLDPSNEMAWNWDTGYKFVLLEGELQLPGEDRRGLVFHIGSDENYKTLLTTAGIELNGGTEANLRLTADVLGMFSDPNYISFQDVNVAMGGETAVLIANNYAQNLFTVSSIE